MEDPMKELIETHGVVKVTADQCQYGLKSSDARDEGLVMKPTGFLTNSPCIAAELQRRCPNRRAQEIGWRPVGTFYEGIRPA